MLIYPNIDPVAIAIGPLKIHWYGLSYLAAFMGSWLLLQYRAKQQAADVNVKQIDDLIFYAAVGVILGGRLGYTLFYNFDYFIQNPFVLLQIWNGGMSFHGGLIGVLVAMWLYARKIQLEFFKLTDFIAVVVPFGLACGRIGNFINAELWGRESSLPWAMVFPTDALGLARHPSMLYEFLLEGILLFIILWLYASKKRPTKAISGLFLIYYGVFRIMIEFVRQPDAHMGNNGFIYSDWLTQGMLLSLPMTVLGLWLFYSAKKVIQ